MIKTVLFVVAAALAVAGALWLAENPSDVRFTWQGWQVAVPMPLVVLAVLVFAAIVALLYRLWRRLRAAPGEARGWFRRRRRERGYRALTQGMVAVAAGDAEEARRQARRADDLLGEPPLTMLLSAQAAQLNGDEAAARRYFTAMMEREETAFLGLRGLLMQAQRDGDRAEALSLAHRARALRPKTPWVLTTLLDLQIAEHRWREALSTLEDAIKRRAIDERRGRHLRTVLLIGCSQAAEAGSDRDGALGYARKAHSQAPDYLPATVRLAALFADAGRRRAATRLVEDAWSRTPHPALAEIYGGLDGEDDPLKSVRRYEKLLALNPDHPESHIAVARAMLAARIWGATRHHLKIAGGDDPPARVCRLMAALEEGENGDLTAGRDWLMRAATAAPDPAWICTECGAATARWTPVCARCGAAGSQEWSTPERARLLEAAPPAAALPAAGDGTAGEAEARPVENPAPDHRPGQPTAAG